MKIGKPTAMKRWRYLSIPGEGQRYMSCFVKLPRSVVAGHALPFGWNERTMSGILFMNMNMNIL